MLSALHVCFPVRLHGVVNTAIYPFIDAVGRDVKGSWLFLTSNMPLWISRIMLYPGESFNEIGRRGTA